MMLLKSGLVFLCLHFAFAQQEDNYTEVLIKNGRIRGHLQLVQTKVSDHVALVSYFLGIPYAKPPVGELRFKRTELPEPWKGTLKVDKMPPACPQYSKYPYPWVDTDPGQSEDCLYLNVWAPMDAVTGDFKRPVKFYVHGDDWLTSGSNRMGYYDGHGDAFDFDEKNKDGVVVVTVNYRLGALGFLSSGTEDVPGNVGLYDIVTALEWTRDNIASFGGDPNDVALVGQGGGAVAASLLLQAPRTTNLFSVLILDGSTLYTLKTLRRYTDGGDGYDINIKLAGKLANAVGCRFSITDDPADTVQCLRDVDASELVRVLSSFSKNQPPSVFLPQFGRDDLIPFDPFDANWHSIGQFILLGFNSDEGSHLLTTRNPNIFGVFGEKDVGISAKSAKHILKKFLINFNESVVDELLGDLDEDSTIENKKKVIKAMGDAHVVCPTLYFAEKYVKKENEVYILEKKDLSTIKNMVLIKSGLVFLCLHFAFAQQEANYTEVLIKTGRIRGRSKLVEAKDRDRFASVSCFLGIPYAKPPVGELRFKRTELPEPWEGTLEADKMPLACPQYSGYPFPWVDTDPGQSEDCLYLNVWAPTDAIAGDFKRPVKFYVHGDGLLTSGSNRMSYYDGQGDAFDFDTKDKDGVVVVTVNYRLGALGFLSSGTEDAPGNVGLYDLVFALEWIRDNIASFGGDPEDVALVGQAGGAIAASLLLQAPRTANLFSVLILDASTLYTLKALRGSTDGGDGYDSNIKLAGKLANAVGCSSSITENPADTVQCLRGVDASELVQVLRTFAKNDPPGVFLPQFGRDDLVPSNPFDADWHSIGQFILLGFNSDEGSHFLTIDNPDIFGVFGEKDVGISAKVATLILKKFLINYDESVLNELLGDLDEESTIKNRRKVIKAMGDAYIVCPMLYLAEKYVKKGNEVYVVEKKVYPPYNPWADWMGSVHFNNVQIDYVHLNETIVVNGKSYTYTKAQREMSIKFKENILGRRWTKFTNEDRLYNKFDQDIEDFDGGTQSNPGGRNCEILRPYFVE
ncbi:hypothetical protein JTE90_001134 [Oedothorax gibbosus]|uniref:Carboxylesterase type B domain-containing protein n=1 Tax=Oedothorax gibbosus TaxID=931172 RepID=A0AAV6VGW2_9ARAC|nr:hypothetical protein JTE90_001134 [Oedothorax gibbosus]